MAPFFIIIRRSPRIIGGTPSHRIFRWFPIHPPDYRRNLSSSHRFPHEFSSSLGPPHRFLSSSSINSPNSSPHYRGNVFSSYRSLKLTLSVHFHTNLGFGTQAQQQQCIRAREPRNQEKKQRQHGAGKTKAKAKKNKTAKAK